MNLTPWRLNDGSWTTICAMPANRTRTAKRGACPRSTKPSQPRPAIKTRLKTTEVDAGTAKDFMALATDIKKALTATKNRYGKRIRLSVTLRWNLAASPAKPGATARMMKGEARTPAATITRHTPVTSRKTLRTRSKKSRRGLFWRYSQKTGTKAALPAPSPMMSRNMLGILKATKKACASMPVPKIPARIMSRMKPVARDSIVKPLMTDADLRIDLCSDMPGNPIDNGPSDVLNSVL